MLVQIVNPNQFQGHQLGKVVAAVEFVVNFEWQIQFQVKDLSLQTLPQPERGQNLFEVVEGFVPGNREVKVPLEVV